MSFASYPEYKDTGVKWLGQSPCDWKIKRFKQVFIERDERSLDGSETLLSVSAYTGVSPRSEIRDQDEHISRSESLEGYKICYPNDLVMNIMLAWNRGLGVSRYEGIVSPAYCVFKIVDDSDPNFLDYLLRTNEYTGYFKCFSTGVIDSRLRIYPDTFRSLHVALPSKEEQKVIAKFLDYETDKIDALVSEQERLIRLLKEKRQAVISNAVTKGLNPKAKMKDSGVEWLGLVPEHWTLRKLKYIAEFAGGGTPSRENLDFWNGEIPWVSPKDMKMEFLENSEEKITQQGLKNSSSNLIEAGQILMVVRSGILKHTIPVAINIVPVSMNQDMKALKFNKAICSSEFFMRWVQGLNDLLLLEWAKQGATVESIEHNYLKETVIPLPPLKEQIQINEYLKKLISEFEGLINSSEVSINLLQERRSALISAAVTGQIDVRNYQLKEVA